MITKENLVDHIIKYESGNMAEPEIVGFFQYLYDNNLWQSLQGHYGRVMTSLISEGKVKVVKN